MGQSVAPVGTNLRTYANDDIIAGITRATEVLLTSPPNRAGKKIERIQWVLNQIEEALQAFEAMETTTGAIPQRLLNLLSYVAVRPAQARNTVMQAAPAIREAAMSQLWQAAEDLGITPPSDFINHEHEPVPPVSDWESLENSPDPWLIALTEDTQMFRKIAQRALKDLRKERASEDWLRPFRELRKRPTRLRLRNILRRDRNHPGHDIYASVIRWGITCSGVFEHDVPEDWYPRLCTDPDLIRRVAETICDYFPSATDPTGPKPDTALRTYADRIAEIYEDLSGQPISYAKTSGALEDSGRPYGRGLDFMLAALRIIDRTLRRGSAVRQIDLIRGWDTPTETG